MSLNNDMTRCTGQRETPNIKLNWNCPVRETCQRYTDKPRNAEIVSWMMPPKISHEGCELKIEVDV